MFPMKFDHKVLETLPVPDTERIQEVLQILRTITMGRVIPYFRKKKGTDPSVIARVVEHLFIKRLEDAENHIHTVSLLSREDKTWIIHIHEVKLLILKDIFLAFFGYLCEKTYFLRDHQT